MADLPRPGEGEPERVEPARDEAHERARKVDPAYAEGELVRVGGAWNQAEAELIQGMLLEHGVPSVLRRTAGFDVPDFLAGGPRGVFVPAAGAETARELLRAVDAAPESDPETAPPAGDGGAVRGDGRPSELRRALWIALAVLLAAGAAALLAWLALQGSA